MYRSKFFKIAIVIVVLGIGIGVLRMWKPGSKQTSEVSPIRRDSVLAMLQTLDIKDASLNDEQKAAMQKKYDQKRDELNAAAKLAQEQGKSQELNLYWPLIFVGNAQRDAKDYQKAELAYQQAHKIDPTAFVPYGNLADLYLHYYYADYMKDASHAKTDRQAQEYLNTAITYYDQVIAIDGPNLSTYYGDLYSLYRYQLDDAQKAEDLLISGVQKYPKELDILTQLADYYRDTGQKEKALQRYQELLEKNPQSTIAKENILQLQ